MQSAAVRCGVERARSYLAPYVFVLQIFRLPYRAPIMDAERQRRRINDGRFSDLAHSMSVEDGSYPEPLFSHFFFSSFFACQGGFLFLSILICVCYFGMALWSPI